MNLCNEIDQKRRGRIDGTTTGGDIFGFLARQAQSTLYQICRSPRKPIESEVISAAAKFFAVFFLKESVLDFDPKVVLVACVNLAAKTEEYHSVSLTDILGSFGDSAAVLKTQVPIVEMNLIAALEYDLVVEQPWPVMLYWVEQIRIKNQLQENAHLRIYDLACAVMHAWQWTDAVLIFPFPQLATAAVLKATQTYAKSNTSPDDSEYVQLETTVLEIFKSAIRDTDIQKLLDSVELIVNRFGPFEKIIKDPHFESSIGFKELLSKFDYRRT